MSAGGCVCVSVEFLLGQDGVGEQGLPCHDLFMANQLPWKKHKKTTPLHSTKLSHLTIRPFNPRHGEPSVICTTPLPWSIVALQSLGLGIETLTFSGGPRAWRHQKTMGNVCDSGVFWLVSLLLDISMFKNPSWNLEIKSCWLTYLFVWVYMCASLLIHFSFQGQHSSEGKKIRHIGPTFAVSVLTCSCLLGSSQINLQKLSKQR